MQVPSEQLAVRFWLICLQRELINLSGCNNRNSLLAITVRGMYWKELSCATYSKNNIGVTTVEVSIFFFRPIFNNKFLKQTFYL